jgi:TIR domain
MNSDLIDLDVFISYASEDKDSVALPLCRLLRSMGVSVWLDENELELGDRLGREIDDAIANCRYGIVILSQAFVEKEWPKRELIRLLTRETPGRKIVLPVLHGVTQEAIEAFQPDLAERKYVTTQSGIPAVANSVLRVLQQDALRAARPDGRTIQEVSGEWELAKAEPLVLGILQEREVEVRDSGETYPPGEEPRMRHRMLGDYYLQYRRRETMIVVTASIEEGVDCHACAPRLSLFEFGRSEASWSLVEVSLAITSWGQWGDVEADSVKVFVLGDNNFGLFLDIAGGNQGVMVTVTTIRARIGDRYREVLRVETSMSDASEITDEPENWNATIRTTPGTSAFYDLVVDRKGTRGTQTFEETELFRFTGQRYVKSDVYR